MTDAKIIDGKGFAAGLRGRIADQVSSVRESHGLVPGLAVVLVGEDPASQVYVRSKGKAMTTAGMLSRERKLPADASQEAVLAEVASLAADPAIHGILVQLPLPDHIDTTVVLDAVPPEKDVDGFHPLNAGRLFAGREALVPCTPQGSMMLLEDTLGSLSGLDALVIGRSNIVGKPMAMLLLAASCTVTMAHSRTRDLAGACRRADIVIAAVGRPEMVRGDWLKPGCTVIDVGINRVPGEGGKHRLVGDVAFDEALSVAGAITPVPGGVGPMTIACLLRNTLLAACAQAGVAVPQG
jgi:methylenetetrahydrofolate dehydrogenase (NADP+) / methenyltetrahydrofolate cyclohydrolase